MAKESVFRFKKFSISNSRSAMKVGTDGVLLGACATIPSACRDILDIGTGTGVVALMLAQRTQDSPTSIKGIDIDAEAALEAGDNFSSSPWKDRLTSLPIPLSEEKGSYDMIVSNPPYYDSSLKNPDKRKSGARHTETLSYVDVLCFAASFLRENGSLSLILPSDNEKDLLRYASSYGLTPVRLLRIRTTVKKQPSRIIAEFVKGAAGRPLVQDTLTISEDGHYTPEYTLAVKDFYLWA